MKRKLIFLLLLFFLLSSCATTPYLTDNDALEELNGMIRYEYNISTYDHQAEQQKELQQKKEFCEKYGHTPYADSYGINYRSLKDTHSQFCIDCRVDFEIEPHTAAKTETRGWIVVGETCYLQICDVCVCKRFFNYRYEPVNLTDVEPADHLRYRTPEERDLYFDEMEAEGLGEWVEYAKEATE